MMVGAELMWTATSAAPEPGKYGLIEPWGYTDGDVYSFLMKGLEATLLINGKPWRGASLKCGDIVEVEVTAAAPPSSSPPSWVAVEFSTDHQPCTFDTYHHSKEEFHD